MVDLGGQRQPTQSATGQFPFARGAIHIVSAEALLDHRGLQVLARNLAKHLATVLVIEVPTDRGKTSLIGGADGPVSVIDFDNGAVTLRNIPSVNS
jgi:hypothetical protein